MNLVNYWYTEYQCVPPRQPDLDLFPEVPVAIQKKVFLLPGNPVSCLSAYDCFVGRSLRMMGGRATEWPYRTKIVKLATKISSQIGRTEYVRLRIENERAFLSLPVVRQFCLLQLKRMLFC